MHRARGGGGKTGGVQPHATPGSDIHALGIGALTLTACVSGSVENANALR
jgi:hypothetical protein